MTVVEASCGFCDGFCRVLAGVFRAGAVGVAGRQEDKWNLVPCLGRQRAGNYLAFERHSLGAIGAQKRIGVAKVAVS